MDDSFGGIFLCAHKRYYCFEIVLQDVGCQSFPEKSTKQQRVVWNPKCLARFGTAVLKEKHVISSFVAWQSWQWWKLLALWITKSFLLD